MLNNDGKIQNTLFTGDNLFVLKGLNSKSVDLIYLDPPFNSKRMYSAPIGSKAAGSSFKDMWTWSDINEAYLENLIQNYPSLVNFIKSVSSISGDDMTAYLTYMAQRIIEMHRILKDTGSFYLHCDPTASHYLKIILDEIFGKENFQNEIIWQYYMGGKPSKAFARKHDVILFYSKSNNKNRYFEKIKVKRYLDFKPSLKDESKEAESGKDEFGYYSVIQCPDVWQIKSVFNMSKEATGYPTQKPLDLLKRIILASTKSNDIVLDPFCGCATTCVAAQQLGRKWIGIDIEEKAVEVLIERLSGDAGIFSNFVARSDVPQRTDIKIEPIVKQTKEQLFVEQKGCCNGCGGNFEIWNFEVDHIVPKTKGGGDYYENYQLLCGSCNRIKGNRPMEYLKIKIQARLEAIKHKLKFCE